MVLKLYGWNGSTPALLVALVLHEKQIPFEWIEVDLTTKKHKAPEYVAKHPFGQVPAIDDDGFILYESRAIARYLDEKYPGQGTQLYPNDLQKRALIDQGVWTDSYHFNRHGVPIFFELLMVKKLHGRETNPAAVAESTKALFQKLDIYEAILSKQKYIVGDEITLADIVHIPVASILLEEANIKLGEGRPNVDRWLNDILSRESWQKTKVIIHRRSWQ